MARVALACLDGRIGKRDSAREPGVARDRQRHAGDHFGENVQQPAKRPSLAQLVGIHRGDVDIDVVRRAGYAVGACAVIAVGLRGELPQRIGLPVALSENACQSRACSGRTRAAASIAADISGGCQRCAGRSRRWYRAPESVRSASERGARTPRHRSSDIHSAGLLSSMSRATKSSGPGSGKIDEIVGLLDRDCQGGRDGRRPI